MWNTNSKNHQGFLLKDNQWDHFIMICAADAQILIGTNKLMLLGGEGCLWLGRMLAWTLLFLNQLACVCYTMCWRRLHSLQRRTYSSLYYAFAFISFDVLRQIPKMTETCLCMSQPSQGGWNMTDTHPHKKEAFSMPVFTYMSSHRFYCPDWFFALCFFIEQELFLMSRADQ